MLLFIQRPRVPPLSVFSLFPHYFVLFLFMSTKSICHSFTFSNFRIKIRSIVSAFHTSTLYSLSNHVYIYIIFRLHCVSFGDVHWICICTFYFFSCCYSYFFIRDYVFHRCSFFDYCILH